MKVRASWYVSMLCVAVCMSAGMAQAKAQAREKQQHVVTLDELNKQMARSADTRQANEEAIRHLLSSDAGQEALKSAHVDYRRVDKAIGQLRDDELAKLADRSGRAESDFAAGLISAKTLAYLILATVVIVVIIVLV
jgi:biopolymer transport protein ExbB/TolQ